MQDCEGQRLRYSIWPEQTLEPPKIETFPVVPEGNRFVYQFYLAGRRGDPSQWLGDPIDVPPEFYLREVMDLDLNDVDALLRLVALYGPMSRGWPLDRLPEPIPERVRQAIETYERYPHEGFSVETVDSIRARVRCIRDATRIWQLETAQIALEELQETWELRELSVDPPESRDDAVRVLAQIMNGGLVPFHAQIALINPDDSSLPLGTFRAAMFSVLCLQLFNHVAEEAVYLKCHNEQCGHLFVRQRGRSRQGKYHLTGVMYCSGYCARAQGQRELRRHKVKQSIKRAGDKREEAK